MMNEHNELTFKIYRDTTANKRVKQVFFFDFDGPLAVPWTHPEESQQGVTDMIKKLTDENIVIALASFNPRAVVAIKEWGIDHYFAAKRAGSNFANSQDRTGLSKHLQIRSMLENELKEYDSDEWMKCFFDDDPGHIKAVTEAETALCFYIEGSQLPYLIAKLLKIEKGFL
jgi:hypothetical protein